MPVPVLWTGRAAGGQDSARESVSRERRTAGEPKKTWTGAATAALTAALTAVPEAARSSGTVRVA
ncbi:hypothetical protein LHJ74_13675 [Streptomyces sp. N2-109]|uniref:Uncharacterized protein n=1 Tax=Streptomyces gossypii TaxID=2883101 RepID=A0ABT2JST3_9ACTN|nr:hypothetical protein [Streptomyces gossypii]MCT2590946.1 hypothetical protein [Streptomyces gossypii]